MAEEIASMKTPIYSLSLAAQAILDMHSLNNEGAEGNQIQPRLMTIVDHTGQMHTVNGISGDMLKHIQTEHFFRIAQERQLALCAGCQQFDANRINADASYLKLIEDKKMTDADAIDEMLRRCAMDDIAGILVTAKGRSLPRKSVIEFGWVLGLPDTADATNQRFFHVKYARSRSTVEREKDSITRVQRNRTRDEVTRGANLQQAIFHRPTNSSIYAIVCNVEVARVGFNDLRQQYALDKDERSRRVRVLLESLLYTFIQLNGAMRSTQLPHLVSLDGIISYSTRVLPAPLISPLQPDYKIHIQHLAKTLTAAMPSSNEAQEGIVAHPFETITEFAETIASLLDFPPYTFQYAER